MHLNTRKTGLILAWSAALIAVIWILLSFLGIICGFASCGSGPRKDAFDVIYLSYTTEPYSSLSVLAPPIVFLILCILYFGLNITWLYASICVIRHYRQWRNFKKIKESGNFWMVITTIVLIFDLILLIIFIIDIICISQEINYLKTQDYPFMNTRIPSKKGGSNRNLLKFLRTRLNQPIDEIQYEASTINTLDDQTEDYIIHSFLRKRILDEALWPTKMKEGTASREIFSPMETGVRFNLNTQDILTSKTNRFGGTNIEAGITISSLIEDIRLNKILNGDIFYGKPTTSSLVASSVPDSKRHGRNINENYADLIEFFENNPSVEVPEDEVDEREDLDHLLFPPIVCLIVAMKCFIFWIALVILLCYFRKKMKNLTQTCTCGNLSKE